jgi:hypothetical protein
MEDDKKEPQTPEEDNGTPPATHDQRSGQTGEKAPGASTNPVPAEDKKFTQADVDRLIQDRLEREKKKYADYDDLKKSAKQLQDIQNSHKTDLEKLQDQISELQGKFTAAELEARTNLLKSAIISAAAKLDFNDPQDAYRLLNTAKLSIEDDGAIKGLEDALLKLAQEKPYLKKQAQVKINPTNPTSGDRLTLDAIKKMTPEQINARWDDVQKVMAGQ